MLDDGLQAVLDQTAADIKSLNEKKAEKGSPLFVDSGQYGVRTLTNAASLFNQSSHTRLWRLKTGLKRSDYHMFSIRISGYSYGNKAGIDIACGGYLYSTNNVLNTYAMSSGTKHCSDVWMGFDNNDNLIVLTGQGISKYYAGVTVDAQLFYGTGSALPGANNPDNWVLTIAPPGNPGSSSSWAGLTQIVRIPVVQK